MYARIENDAENPDFITGNEIARIGIIENPKAYDSSSNLTIDKASAAYAMRLVGTGYSSATFTPDSIITQTVGTGVTAIGKVINYDTTTGVLKYWQDRTMAGFTTTTSTVTGVAVTNPQYGYEITRFSAAISEGGTFKRFLSLTHSFHSFVIHHSTILTEVIFFEPMSNTGSRTIFSCIPTCYDLFLFTFTINC